MRAVIGSVYSNISSVGWCLFSQESDFLQVKIHLFGAPHLSVRLLGDGHRR